MRWRENIEILDSLSWYQPLKDQDEYTYHYDQENNLSLYLNIYESRYLHLNLKAFVGKLNFDEKIQFIKTVTKVNKRRIPFICSVTAADVDESIELTKSANSFDADGICVQLPATFKFSQKENFLKNYDNVQ